MEAELKSDGVIGENSYVRPVSDEMIDRGWLTVAQMIFPDEQTWTSFIEKTGLQRKVRRGTCSSFVMALAFFT